MKNYITLLIGLAGAASAQTSSFSDWTNSGWSDGDLSGSAAWAGYGTVSGTITGTAGATFLSNTGTQYPSVSKSQGDLEPYGADLTSAGALTWLTGGDPGVDSSTGEFTFSGPSGSVFPEDSVFYITDNDVEAVRIEAFIGSTAVDVSQWYEGNVQSSSNGFGNGSGWDPATGTTVPAGKDAEFWVQQFKPDAKFDTLRITNQTGSNGRIGFTIGNVIVPPTNVPEPSSMVLLGMSALGFLARRKR